MLDETNIIKAFNGVAKLSEFEQTTIPDDASDEEIFDEMSRITKRLNELDRSIEDLTNIKEELDRAFSSEIADLQIEYGDLVDRRHGLFLHLYETRRKSFR